MRVYPGADLFVHHQPDPIMVAEFPQESRWQATVERYFRQLGWSTYHTWSSIKSSPGFPDLAAWHPLAGQVVFAELKTEKGKVTVSQASTLADLAASGAEVYLWRPSDMDEIMALLQDTARMAAVNIG